MAFSCGVNTLQFRMLFFLGPPTLALILEKPHCITYQYCCTATAMENFKGLALLFLTEILIIHPNHVYSINSDQFIKNLVPTNYSANRSYNCAAVKLNWTLIPHGVQSLSAKDMEFSVDVSIKTNWFDDQLVIPNEALHIIPKEVATRLWHPFLEFTNCKGCREILIDPDQQKFQVNQKKVWVLYRRTFHFNCIFDLTRYPFDVQICQMDVQLIIWHGLIDITIEEEKKRYRSIDKNHFFMPSEYQLLKLDVLPKICLTEQNNINFTCFSYVYVFRRKPMQQVLLIFVPSLLIVILSWISFWLDVEMAAARVALGLTSLLTLATTFNSAQKNLPAISTLKALDVWMFVCIFMVFASLVEYAIAFNYYKRPNSKPSAEPLQSKVYSMHRIPHKVISACRHWEARTPSIADGFAKVAFPVLFIIFNFYFWLHYAL